MGPQTLSGASALYAHGGCASGVKTPRTKSEKGAAPITVYNCPLDGVHCSLVQLVPVWL